VVSGAPLLVLASASPQRRAILTDLGIPFEACPTEVEEETGGAPEAVVVRNALRKARAAQAQVGRRRSVLGADTEVFLDGRQFGKPETREEARSFLTELSGRTHEVFTGLALLEEERSRTGVERTAVTFRELDSAAIEDYLKAGEWRGRAGGYAVQGEGERLIAGIDGDYWNVVGLPTALLLDLAPALRG
jgi:septum formation protein